MKPPQRAATMLLVDDNPNDIELAAFALRCHGLADGLVTARDGQEALDFLFGQGAWTKRGIQRPRVVLLDLKMPKVGGAEVLRQVRANPATNTIPVVILTASPEERDIIQAYALGANGYVVKPFEFEKLSETIGAIASYWLVANQPPPPHQAET